MFLMQLCRGTAYQEFAAARFSYKPKLCVSLAPHIPDSREVCLDTVAMCEREAFGSGIQISYFTHTFLRYPRYSCCFVSRRWVIFLLSPFPFLAIPRNSFILTRHLAEDFGALPPVF